MVWNNIKTFGAIKVHTKWKKNSALFTCTYYSKVLAWKCAGNAITVMVWFGVYFEKIGIFDN